ncbi:MAG: hypothetical protein JO019_02655 [Candidatus Kaiserbacteria bacterium]|nr:hypothetical protein [Candidatus Kaiserbacteria bacterium]
MDNTRTNTTAWIVGAIIVLLVIAGIWWAVAAYNNSSPGLPNTGVDNTTSGVTTSGTGTGSATY